MSVLGLTFASPLVLLGLIALPAIWYLLRLTPPRPIREVFPPTRILEELDRKEETPAHSPWWLTLLRLLMAALVILALSEPVWNAQDKVLSGDGPVLVVFDDGWASAKDWDDRVATTEALLDEARQAERPVAFVLTSEGARSAIEPTSATQAATRLAAATPRPLDFASAELASKIATGGAGFTTAVWIGDGLQRADDQALVAALTSAGVEEIVHFSADGATATILTDITNDPDALKAVVRRAVSTQAQSQARAGSGDVVAFDLRGRPLGRAPFAFDATASETTATLDLPVELRNEIARIEIDNERTAGAVRLLDERFRRRRVGLVSGAKTDREQPLLSPLYYISRALQPFTDVREADDANLANAIPQLIDEGASTLVLADIGTLPESVAEPLAGWIERGGMLVRFAGPRLSAAQDDAFVPVELRRGGRSLGGTLTWGTAQPLAGFTDDSPFAGLDVPADVTVSRQVLAEPSVELANRTWANLEDGTPLVTATQRGTGWIVLFHTTADASWSNLSLSGVFVDMLRRIVAVSNGAIAAERARNDVVGDSAASEPATVTLPPMRLLDGYGRLGTGSGNARPLAVAPGRAPVPGIDNPPGLYGASDAFVALNLFDQSKTLTAFDASILPAGSTTRSLNQEEALSFKPWLLGAAMMLLALDCLAVLWMGGAFRRMPRRGGTAVAGMVLAALFVISAPSQGWAQDDGAPGMEDALRTKLAFVKTGNARIDAISRKGLSGLTRFLASRTSLEPAPPVGVDIASDELAFYPLLYWPIDADMAVPDEAAMARVDAFMKRGGSVLFDTRDQLTGGFGSGAVSDATLKLRSILAGLDVPALEPVPENHVLTRAFYLLDVFPGRYRDGQLWVEASSVEEDDIDRPARPGDGVSSILITSNDLAGAWAVEADGQSTLPLVPPNPNQRIYAYRTGVNIVMYTLTGNYKADQVHIPALLERLGQ